jgi:thiol-disulfide isomerase/thioredoxin
MSRASHCRGVSLLALSVLLGWLSIPAAAQARPAALSAAEVRDRVGEWGGSERDLDREALRRLAEVPKDAEVKVFFATWCGNSQQEVPRFLKILSHLRQVPFSVKFFEVDRDKKEAPFLPTFVVTRQGREVGRIVERSPRALETDLTRLLDGKTEGLVSASEPVIWYYLSSSDEASTPPD